jgi:hypothetical protein
MSESTTLRVRRSTDADDREEVAAALAELTGS